MADNKVESQIGEFKSPEALAKELEKNNKKLADRVREISQKAIESDSRDLRKRLQEELTPEEQLEIRETLPNSGVGKVLNKGLTSEEKQAQVAHEAASEVIGEDNAKSLAKAEGYAKSLGDAWDVAGKLFEEGKWVAALGVILKGLFGQFSLKAWEKKDEEKKDGKEGKLDTIKNAEYSLGLKALYIISGKELTKESNNTLLSPQFQKSTFSQLEQEYKNKNGIATRLGFENNQSDDEKVYTTITLLLKSEKGLNNIFGKDNPDWKKLKLVDLILLLNKKGGGLLSNMKEKVENIQFNGLDPIGNMKTALGSLKGMLEVNISGNELDFGGLSERKNLIDGVSKETQLKIFMSGGNSWVKKSSQSAEVENNLAGNGTQEDKDFIKKVFSYKDKIIQPIINLFPKDEQGNATQFFSEKGITFKELTELYLITGGNPDITNIDGMSKSLLYIKIFGILSRDNDEGLSGAFAKELYEQIMDDKSIVLPEEAKNIFKNILQKAMEKTIDGAKGLLIDIYKVSDTSTKIAVGSLVAGYISWMIFGGRFRIFTQAVGTVSLAAIATYIYVKFMEDPNASKLLKEKGIDSKEKFVKEVEKTTKS